MLKLSIKIPEICNCISNCRCRQFIKCKNNCFCGNITNIKQDRTEYSALTPDYVTPKIKLRKNKSNVNFGKITKIIVERLVYHSPRFFDNIRRNKIIGNYNLSPRCIY
jgi:hypothetical protein